jgi:aromatic ring-opening dioxygenase catalytic subunit (LigB family)
VIVQPAVFVSHGAPTLVIEPSPARDFLAGLGAALERRFGRPQAVLVVSAHWETDMPTVGAAAEFETIHDFDGFSDELYRIRYPGRGAEDVARAVIDRLDHPTDEHLLPFFTVLGAASAGAPLRGIHASATFGSLRMDAFEAS